MYTRQHPGLDTLHKPLVLSSIHNLEEAYRSYHAMNIQPIEMEIHQDVAGLLGQVGLYQARNDLQVMGRSHCMVSPLLLATETAGAFPDSAATCIEIGVHYSAEDKPYIRDIGKPHMKQDTIGRLLRCMALGLIVTDVRNRPAEDDSTAQSKRFTGALATFPDFRRGPLSLRHPAVLGHRQPIDAFPAAIEIAPSLWFQPRKPDRFTIKPVADNASLLNLTKAEKAIVATSGHPDSQQDLFEQQRQHTLTAKNLLASAVSLLTREQYTETAVAFGKRYQPS